MDLSTLKTRPANVNELVDLVYQNLENAHQLIAQLEAYFQGMEKPEGKIINLRELKDAAVIEACLQEGKLPPGTYLTEAGPELHRLLQAKHGKHGIAYEKENKIIEVKGRIEYLSGQINELQGKIKGHEKEIAEKQSELKTLQGGTK